LRTEGAARKGVLEFALTWPFNVRFEETLQQARKLAERVLAPGDGEAEPGEPNTRLSPRTGRQIKGERKKLGLGFFITIFRIQSVASFAGSLELLVRHPRLGFAIAWG
jgi:hypothetical protein